MHIYETKKKKKKLKELVECRELSTHTHLQSYGAVGVELWIRRGKWSPVHSKLLSDARSQKSSTSCV